MNENTHITPQAQDIPRLDGIYRLSAGDNSRTIKYTWLGSLLSKLCGHEIVVRASRVENLFRSHNQNKLGRI